MDRIPLQNLPVTPRPPTVKARAPRRLREVVDSLGADSPLVLSTQEVDKKKSDERKRKAGEKRFANFDLAEAAKKHDINSAADLDRVMAELKRKIKFLEELQDNWEDTQDEAEEQHAARSVI